MIRVLLPLLLLLAAMPAQAWWNGDWTARRAFTINTADTGTGVKETQANVPVLRLHMGNFDFLGANVDGSDLRFVAGDYKTPLNFQIEKFDSNGEQALVWVQVPKLEGGNDKQQIWLYFWPTKVRRTQATAKPFTSRVTCWSSIMRKRAARRRTAWHRRFRPAHSRARARRRGRHCQDHRRAVAESGRCRARGGGVEAGVQANLHFGRGDRAWGIIQQGKPSAMPGDTKSLTCAAVANLAIAAAAPSLSRGGLGWGWGR
ncbi:DUF2341 domain-containing protein [Thiobacillus sp.]